MSDKKLEELAADVKKYHTIIVNTDWVYNLYERREMMNLLARAEEKLINYIYDL